jgi:hypothetical protein
MARQRIVTGCLGSIIGALMGALCGIGVFDLAVLIIGDSGPGLITYIQFFVVCDAISIIVGTWHGWRMVRYMCVKPVAAPLVTEK